MLVSISQLKKETNQGIEKAVNEPTEVQDKPLLKNITEGNLLKDGLNLEKRKEMISAKGFEPVDFAYERAIGKNDSLYSNFTELIALTKRKVGRIVIKEDNKIVAYATGFMVSPQLMLTNWHVFQHSQIAEDSEVHFFYEYNAQGHPLSPLIFKFDTRTFFNDEALDYCFVGVQSKDINGKVSLANIGYLFLDRALGKIGDVEVEKLNIIHHPQGDYKQISIRENTFVGITETKIFYETDTAQGSSGSPVFNDQWQVVGLHHKSIARMTADEQNYLDKDGNIIPAVEGKIDISKIVWLKNEGIRISVILNHLIQKNPHNEVIAQIAIAPPAENLNFMINNKEVENNLVETQNQNTMSKDQHITISVPSNVLNSENTIDISLSSRKINPTNHLPTTDNKMLSSSNELLLEVAKVDKEQAIDFSKCKGYEADFLGIHIPLPQPSQALEQQIARLRNNEIELKYFKYSVIFNAVKKMPLISAINVEGEASKRLDNSKRSDDWLRDKRIDSECQLSDKFYAKSNFDKGHMSRFEDANWGDTEADALRNGIYTCFYTNACPQVVALNRAGGLWGKLEKAVLEKGIKKEQGQLARMTVFNGPIFNEVRDKVFKGVVIPMEFYKIILWLNDQGALKATAFKLSQETLVGHIQFDEFMRADYEALDIDKVAVFKHYQCSIKNLSSLTKIDFSHLEVFDTFQAHNASEQMTITNENEISF